MKTLFYTDTFSKHIFNTSSYVINLLSEILKSKFCLILVCWFNYCMRFFHVFVRSLQDLESFQEWQTGLISCQLAPINIQNIFLAAKCYLKEVNSLPSFGKVRARNELYSQSFLGKLFIFTPSAMSYLLHPCSTFLISNL